MLIVRYKNEQDNLILEQKYIDYIKYIDKEKFINLENWPINYLEDIKQNIQNFKVILISYDNNIIKYLDALHLEYTFVISESDLINFQSNNLMDNAQIILKDNETLEDKLGSFYNWIQKDQLLEVSVKDKNELTLEEFVNNDIAISEADIQDLKTTQNKLKVGLLLQAKNNLHRILKLTTILDKLQDELITRIDNNLEYTDTASLMYTTEFISKSLNETNQFLINLINNEKMQNFFIIDNSNVININNNEIDIDKRERIRKAASIVLNNLDFFEKGDYNNLVNPNIDDRKEELNDNQ